MLKPADPSFLPACLIASLLLLGGCAASRHPALGQPHTWHVFAPKDLAPRKATTLSHAIYKAADYCVTRKAPGISVSSVIANEDASEAEIIFACTPQATGAAVDPGKLRQAILLEKRASLPANRSNPHE